MQDQRNGYDVIQYFGQTKLDTSPNIYELGAGIQISETIASEYISSSIKELMKGNTDTVNVLLFDLCTKHYVNTKQKIINLTNVVYNTMIDVAQNYHQLIQQLIDTDQLSIDRFAELQSEYMKNSSKMVSMCHLLKNYISINGNDVFKIIKDYVFYKIILEKPYLVKTEQVMIFNILISMIGITTFGSSRNKSITNVFKIINQYNGFSYSVLDRKTRSEIFSTRVDESAKAKVIDSQMMIEIVTKIDSNIRKLCQMSGESDQIKELIRQITDDVQMCQRVGDPVYFVTLYQTFLLKRLLQNNGDNKITTDVSDNKINLGASDNKLNQSASDNKLNLSASDNKLNLGASDNKLNLSAPDNKLNLGASDNKLNLSAPDNKLNLGVERAILKLIRYDDAPDTRILMEFALNDIDGSKFINNEYQNIAIQFDSAKYDQNMIASFNRKITNFRVLRQSAWKNVGAIRSNTRETNDSLTAIEMHLDIFNKYYMEYFNARYYHNSARYLEYSYDQSIVYMTIGFDKTQYKLKMTMGQGNVLSHLVSGSMNLDRLVEKTGMDKDSISVILNSLIVSGLVCQQDISTKEMFAIDYGFCSDTQYIDVIQFIGCVIQKMTEKKQTPEPVLEPKELFSDISDDENNVEMVVLK
ncbi:MAG: hypothetical protein Dasosvirus5_5 [Dasosvirus sp.]|uniref:Cullin family protein n=1 Tax=Dasosvirus sp. TaxID=2487764 RepID=A0A3G4ZRJ0_9VIRU|nr:MAG: hypothetical protein Dasosvirus5_5 [Dasosvirus sp.]